MAKAAAKSELDDLHALLAKRFKEALAKPDCPPATLNAARQFLKDNGIEALADCNDDLGDLAKEISGFDPDDYHTPH